MICLLDSKIRGHEHIAWPHSNFLERWRTYILPLFCVILLSLIKPLSNDVVAEILAQPPSPLSRLHYFPSGAVFGGRWDVCGWCALIVPWVRCEISKRKTYTNIDVLKKNTRFLLPAVGQWFLDKMRNRCKYVIESYFYADVILPSVAGCRVAIAERDKFLLRCWYRAHPVQLPANSCHAEFVNEWLSS